MGNAGSSKSIVNFMTSAAGVRVLGRGHKDDRVENALITLLFFSLTEVN